MINLVCFFIILSYFILGSIIFNREGEAEFKELQKKLKKICCAKENTMIKTNSI